MDISKNIKIVDLGLKIGKTLILADLHIGYEEALNKQGLMVPRFQFKDLQERLEKILKKANPDVIVVNGDIKHEFGRISGQEWRETLKILDLLARNSKRVILVRGNHDKKLGPIAKKRDIEVVDEYEIGGDDIKGREGKILVVHGDKETRLPKNTRTIIIGHEHPAVSIREGQRTETFKCFLKGKYRGKELIVMPSCNLVTEGSDITKEGVLSPFLKQRLDDFEVFVVEDAESDKIYRFGKLKNIR
ncbi:phosphoesterase [Candidatus Woesearchaeota archaeon CG10_big_fil_rev_8_21_14_0_10_44_13]|nr:MAG: phosphoesterase [Candidatus Woesearchaeota archaeon CG10_big_fil_rev_8_21_14_0_10_44_13]